MELTALTDPDRPAAIVITLTDRETAALGADAVDLPRWLTTVMDALVGLRSGDLPTATLYAALTALQARLDPRLQGITDALIRVQATRGSITQLGSAIDAPKSTAGDARTRVLAHEPTPFELWARTGAPAAPRSK